MGNTASLFLNDDRSDRICDLEALMGDVFEGEPGKYVVFKRGEFEAIIADKGTATRNELMRRAVEDAVVIRRQDVFSPPAFDAYANSILTTCEGMRALTKDNMTLEERFLTEGLQETAHYFQHQAALAWDTDRKLPD